VASTGKPEEIETYLEPLEMWIHISAFSPEPGHFVAVFENINKRKRAEEKVTAYQRVLRSLGAKLALAEEQERRRIAADLHDDVVQSLAAAGMRLKTIRATAIPESAAAPLQESIDLVQRAIHDTRSLMFDLSPPPLYELGLEAAVEWLAEKIQSEHRLTVRDEAAPEPIPLDEEVRGILFRAIRELLQNVIKHARATTATISLRRVNDHIHVEVTDNGRGFDSVDAQANRSKLGGFGLFEIRERLDYFGGSLTLDAAEGRGLRAVLLAPLKVGAPK
jgi:signal transduction histidine kinase